MKLKKTTIPWFNTRFYTNKRQYSQLTYIASAWGAETIY